MKNNDALKRIKRFKSECKNHFKTHKWPLNYVIYLDDLKIGMLEFNNLLNKLNYKIYYNKKRNYVVFKPKESKVK